MRHVPKTLQEIYKDVLIDKYHPKLKDNKVLIRPWKLRWQDKWLEWIHPMPIIRKHILRPTRNRMATGIPPPWKVDMDERFVGFAGHGPRCKWAFCGRNIELGYEYCDEHRILCDRCNTREPIMSINGEHICSDC